MLIFKRLLAFTIDYAVIICYGVLLFGASTFITSNFDINIEKIHPFKAQTISFITLTIPTFLYFYLSEISNKKASIGKRVMKLFVESDTLESRKNSVLKRNILKFLPWEIAHTGIHWMNYYGFENPNIPVWIWIIIITSEVIAVIYLVSIFYYKGSKSVYDSLSKTIVTIN